MRRTLLTLSIAVACVAVAQPADAQLKFGPQVSLMTQLDDLAGVTGASDLSGTFGFGARVALQPPVVPIGLVGQGTYYMPDCTGDCSYMTYSLAGQLRLPLPIVSPYAIAGWQWRRSGDGTTTTTENGLMGGVGVQINLGVSIFLEGVFEVGEEIPTQTELTTSSFVIQGGVLFG